MAVTLEELEAKALKLSIKERSELVRRLLVSLDGEPEGSPEEIAKAWEEEIARRVTEIDAGRAELISGDEVLARVDRTIANHQKLL